MLITITTIAISGAVLGWKVSEEASRRESNPLQMRFGLSMMGAGLAIGVIGLPILGFEVPGDPIPDAITGAYTFFIEEPTMAIYAAAPPPSPSNTPIETTPKPH